MKKDSQLQIRISHADKVALQQIAQNYHGGMSALISVMIAALVEEHAKGEQ